MSVSEYHKALMEDSRMGTTEEGRAWALKAVHPPSSPNQAYAGLPDYSTTARLIPSYRTKKEIGYDGNMWATPPDPLPSTYSIQIICPDIPEIAFMYRLFNESKPSDGWSRLRVVRTSLFDNYSDPNYTLFQPLGGVGISKSRVVASSITGEFIASSLVNQGVLYVGQIVPFSHIETSANVANNLPVTSEVLQTATSPFFQVFLPESETQLIQVCPKFYTGRAKDGFFCPAKFTSSLMSLPFVDTSLAGVSVISPAGGDRYWSAEGILVTTFSDPPPLDNAPPPTPYTPDSASTTPGGQDNWINGLGAGELHGHVSWNETSMTWPVIFAKGLAGPGANSSSSFSVSCYKSLDCFVPNNGQLAAFTHDPPMWDEVAIKYVASMHQMMPDGYPSVANGFFDWVRNAIGWLANKATPIVHALAPVPGLGEVLGAGHDLIKTVDNILPPV